MKRFIRNNIDIIIVSLIIIALLLIVFKEVIFFDRVFVKRDIGRFYYPLRDFTARMIRQGGIPLWNPYLFCGTPAHASIQNSIFYPLSLIYYITDTARGLSLFIIVHIFLCGLFMYLFMRGFKVSKEAAFLSALCFAFSGYVMSAINLTIALNAVTWFPLSMLIFLKGLRARRYRYSLFLGFVLTMMFLAGDPSIVISTAAIIFLTSCYLFMERLIRDKRPDAFIACNLIISLSAFFLLSAFQLLPALEYYSRTLRTSMCWGEISAWSVPFSDLFSFIIPYFNDLAYYYNNYWARQAWLDNYYLGITTLLIAGFALPLIRRDRRVQFLCIIGLITIAVCLGRYFIVYPLIYKFIPIVRIMRYPVRFFYIFTFSACALAGIGYDRLKEMLSKGAAQRLTRVFLLISFLSVLSVIALTLFTETITSPIAQKVIEAHSGNNFFKPEKISSLVYADIFNLRRSLLYISSFGLFIFLCARAKRKGLITIAAFLVVGFDIMFANTGYEPTEDRAYFEQTTENVRYVMKDKSLFRIMASPYATDRFNHFRETSYYEGLRNAKDRFVSNRMMEFGIYDMWGYGSTVLRRNLKVAQKIHSQKAPSDTRLLDLLNVKYISARPGLNIPGYKKASETPAAAIYLNKGCLPRAMLIRKVITLKQDKDILEYMFSKEFKPGREVILAEAVSLPKSADRRYSFGKDKVEVVKYRPRRIEISASAAKPSFLLLSDTYYPGWKAYVDGELKKIYRADYFLRAVKIPEGEHRVSFIYDPLSFKAGAWISIISLLISLLYIGAERLRLTRL